MGHIVYKALIDGLSLNIDEDMITVSSSKELDMIFFNFSVDNKLCGMAIKKEEFELNEAKSSAAIRFQKALQKEKEKSERNERLSKPYVDKVMGKKNDEKSVKEEVEIEEELKKGDRVRHKDGTLGTVTREPDEQGLVQWKHAGNKHRVSKKDVLKSAAGEKFRWRQQQEEVEQKIGRAHV